VEMIRRAKVPSSPHQLHARFHTVTRRAKTPLFLATAAYDSAPPAVACLI
jgi:hypothetical protein